MNALTPAVSTGPLPASRKIHKSGVLHPHIKVPMREISVHPTAGEPPVTVYDPSGPCTDPTVETSIDTAKRMRLPPPRWPNCLPRLTMRAIGWQRRSTA
ncbi:hypothetical protein ABID19_006868, partial [Mesorhizobium robiniae]